MRRIIVLVFCFGLLSSTGYSQSSTTTSESIPGVFDRIAKSVKAFKLDTTDAPDDKVTRKIIQLRSLRGGFNINEAIDFKIDEDRQKNEISREEIEKIAAFFKSGDGKRWLDNATIWIYRSHFTYNELKALVKFYKTSAGQKIAADFPIIMMESLSAAEMIKELYVKQQKTRGGNF